MLARSKKFAFTGIAIMWFVIPRMVAADTKVEKRFLDEYPAASEKLMTSINRLKGKIKKEEPDINGRVETRYISFASDHGMWMGECSREVGGKTMKVIFCSGGEKLFALGKNEGKNDYFIVDARFPDRIEEVAGYSELKELCSASYAIGGKPIIDIVRAPGFKISNATLVDMSGNRCVKITYSSDSNVRGANATVVFDPSHSWVIRKASVKTNSINENDDSEARSVQISVDYETPLRVAAIPSRVTIESPFIKGKRVYEYTDIRVEGTPKQDFTMEHYGVSDANWNYKKDVLKASPRLIFLWITVLLIVTLCIVIVIRRIREARSVAHS